MGRDIAGDGSDLVCANFSFDEDRVVGPFFIHKALLHIDHRQVVVQPTDRVEQADGAQFLDRVLAVVLLQRGDDLALDILGYFAVGFSFEHHYQGDVAVHLGDIAVADQLGVDIGYIWLGADLLHDLAAGDAELELNHQHMLGREAASTLCLHVDGRVVGEDALLL